MLSAIVGSPIWLDGKRQWALPGDWIASVAAIDRNFTGDLPRRFAQRTLFPDDEGAVGEYPSRLMSMHSSSDAWATSILSKGSRMPLRERVEAFDLGYAYRQHLDRRNVKTRDSGRWHRSEHPAYIFKSGAVGASWSFSIQREPAANTSLE